MRMALGATPASVIRLVIAQGGLLVGVGLIIGLAAARAGSNFIASLLYGVQTSDWQAYAMATVVVIAGAALASYIPARRVATIDPLVVLRSE
jgi:putative ABC transport system permease protein